MCLPCLFLFFLTLLNTTQSCYFIFSWQKMNHFMVFINVNKQIYEAFKSQYPRQRQRALFHQITDFCSSNMTKCLHVSNRFRHSQHASELILHSSVHLFHPPLFFCQFSPPPNPPLRLGRLLFAAAVTDPLLFSAEVVGGDVSLVPAGDEMCLVMFIHWLFHCFAPPCADLKKLALTPSTQLGNHFCRVCTGARLSPGLK